MSADENARRGRENIEGRWAAYREARLAAGLPATKREERRAKPRFLPPDLESHWLAEAAARGLTEGMPRTAARQVAKRLAQAAAAEQARRGTAATAAGADDDVLVAYWENEHALWSERAERDHAIAASHEMRADDAARQLAALLSRLGRL